MFFFNFPRKKWKTSIYRYFSIRCCNNANAFFIWYLTVLTDIPKSTAISSYFFCSMRLFRNTARQLSGSSSIPFCNSLSNSCSSKYPKGWFSSTNSLSKNSIFSGRKKVEEAISVLCRNEFSSFKQWLRTARMR